jgi:hypothetical protein
LALEIEPSDDQRGARHCLYVRHRPHRVRFGDRIDAHPLHREITATVVANAVVNRAGISFLSRLADETGTGLPDLARAHIAARDIFAIGDTWSAIDDLDLRVPAATQDGCSSPPAGSSARRPGGPALGGADSVPRSAGSRTGGGGGRPIAGLVIGPTRHDRRGSGTPEVRPTRRALRFPSRSARS